MHKLQQFIAIIKKEENQYVALCPELDIASQGVSVEELRTNLVEALWNYFLNRLLRRKLKNAYMMKYLLQD